MKTKTVLLMIIALFLLMGAGCEKEDDINKLPPVTQTGENTFGCKINGVVYSCSAHWKPGDIPAMQGVSGNYSDGIFVIYALVAKNKTHDIGNISFSFECVENRPGMYREGLKYKRLSPVKGYDSKVEISRFDNDVISGTFQMKFQFSDDIDDIIEFTEGRFDIKRNN